MIIFGNVIFESMMQSEVPRELLGARQFGRLVCLARRGCRSGSCCESGGQRHRRAGVLRGLQHHLRRTGHMDHRLRSESTLSTPTGFTQRQFWSRSQGESHHARALARLARKDQVGTKRATLGFAHATTANFHPLIAGRLVHDVGDEGPSLASSPWARSPPPDRRHEPHSTVLDRTICPRRTDRASSHPSIVADPRDVTGVT